jgi:hypothetical protein
MRKYLFVLCLFRFICFKTYFLNVEIVSAEIVEWNWLPEARRGIFLWWLAVYGLERASDLREGVI